MPISKRFRHILAGFCMGMGFIIIVFAFLIWAFTNTLVDAFNSWAEQHGYTLAQSGLVATYQLPFIFTLIVVLGLIVLILGVIVVMIAKDEAQIPPSPP